MGKKILLADDSITIQKVIELTFSDEDFDVVTVGNGRLAIEKAQEIRPDIVLCDIIMPEKDGYEVCEFIKKTPGLQGIPVLLLTGAFEPFDQERAARVGSDGYLAKPFEPETLIAKVKDLLSRAAARPAASAPPARPSPPTSSSAIPFAPPAREGESPRTASSPIPPLTVVPPRPPDPIPFPRVAAPEPTKAPPAMAPPASSVSFIPEEPFEDLDAGSFLADDDPAAAARPSEQAAFQSAADELLPMTAEESESLGVPDSASTVMFKADQVSWQAPPSASAPPAAPPVMAAPPPAPEPELPSEVTVFEEVIEEDVEFGGVYSPPPVYLSEPAGRFEAPPPPVLEEPRPAEPPPTASFRPVARPFEPETVEIPSPAPAPSLLAPPGRF